MAQKTTIGTHKSYIGINKKKPRKGIHSKNASTSNKKSKNYKKTYRGQGRV